VKNRKSLRGKVACFRYWFLVAVTGFWSLVARYLVENSTAILALQ